MKKCPPGVICFENITMGFFFIVLFFIMYLIYLNLKVNKTENIIIKENETTTPSFGVGFLPSFPYTNVPTDVLINPYSAPLKDDRYFIPEIVYRPPASIPINVSTNVGAVDTTYRQMGILTPLNGTTKDNILPLMGRPLFTNRDKYQYYSISNQHNNVKLPILFKGKSALNEYGVDQIYNGDSVYIEGYNEPFKVTMYDNNTIKYLPFV
jgi:hypothetical protein